MLDYMRIKMSGCIRDMFQHWLLHPGFNAYSRLIDACSHYSMSACLYAYVVLAWLAASACMCRGNIARFDRLHVR